MANKKKIIVSFKPTQEVHRAGVKKAFLSTVRSEEKVSVIIMTVNTDGSLNLVSNDSDLHIEVAQIPHLKQLLREAM